jgi:hypothetical protein
VEVKIHVLVHRREFAGDRLVEKLDTLFFFHRFLQSMKKPRRSPARIPATSGCHDFKRAG